MVCTDYEFDLMVYLVCLVEGLKELPTDGTTEL